MLNQSQKPPLANYSRQVINLIKDEKTIEQIALCLSQEYSVEATEQDIRELIFPNSKPKNEPK